MDFIYTVHAEEKIAERKFTKALIEQTIVNPDSVMLSRFGRKIAEKEIGGKLLRIVYEEQESLYIIITRGVKPTPLAGGI